MTADLHELEAALGSSGEAREVEVEQEGVRVRASIREGGKVANRYREIVVRDERPGAPRSVADVARDLVGSHPLGEPLEICEVEAHRAIVRTRRDALDRGRYHELDVRPGEVRIHRRRVAGPGEPAEPCPMDLTHEQARRVAEVATDALVKREDTAPFSSP